MSGFRSIFAPLTEYDQSVIEVDDGQSPDFDVSPASEELLDTERRQFSISSVGLNSRNDPSSFLLGKKVPGALLSIWEPDEEKIANDANSAGYDTFYDEDPGPAPEVCGPIKLGELQRGYDQKQTSSDGKFFKDFC